MKKSRLFSLLCACWPGAGEMYLGLMNRGLAIMLLFWGIIILCVSVGSAILLLILPVIWFYSFFDTLTLRNLDYYALTELQERDEYFFQELIGDRYDLPGVVQKYHIFLGFALIIAGGFLLYDRLVRWFWRYDIIPEWLYHFLDQIPSMLVAFGIIALGVWLVRGKRMPADEVEGFPQYKELGKEEKRHDKRTA